MYPNFGKEKTTRCKSLPESHLCSLHTKEKKTSSELRTDSCLSSGDNCAMTLLISEAHSSSTSPDSESQSPSAMAAVTTDAAEMAAGMNSSRSTLKESGSGLLGLPVMIMVATLAGPSLATISPVSPELEKVGATEDIGR